MIQGMADLNYDPRPPAEPTTWWWKTVRFMIIVFWVVLALVAIRWLTMDDDTISEDSSAVVAVD